MSTIDLPQARRQLIAERLAAGHAVIAADLAAEFGLSEDAIRRDLRALAAEGLCRRVYGGAVPVTAGDPPLAARLREAPDRKSALARAGAATVRPGELVFIDTGSTNLALVDFLPEDAGLTVATNGVDVAAAVLHRQDLRLIVIGGEVDPHLGGCVDAAAVESLRDLRIDRCFVGACALSTQGLMTPQFNEATFKRTVIRNSRHRVALITSDKVAAQAPHRIAELSALQTVVLEQGADAGVIDALREAGVAVIQVEAAR
ncbi:MAG: DeoR/GlpR transcriptional regulator [Mitsuaria chitosanitabida]|jgi:DeoR/GlpR family transcriptional regulator of sugar metabolism|uniref:DeoR/GlpR family DNA-binding transcription regulator n=1 Tax=Roseateles chitosanitabidus TaxID=65048 RepID=UPI001B24ADBA|nr:DeoR/GlpR family DNA-binding transcription regulator [Roseateles chitosanitabidus]MBO9685355.1 DeoR/GlpR transcriptional regulator [Roseateles chitosanitabidus]